LENTNIWLSYIENIKYKEKSISYISYGLEQMRSNAAYWSQHNPLGSAQLTVFPSDHKTTAQIISLDVYNILHSPNAASHLTNALNEVKMPLHLIAIMEKSRKYLKSKLAEYYSHEKFIISSLIRQAYNDRDEDDINWATEKEFKSRKIIGKPFEKLFTQWSNTKSSMVDERALPFVQTAVAQFDYIDPFIIQSRILGYRWYQWDEPEEFLNMKYRVRLQQAFTQMSAKW
jgi:hypothetical protein